MPKVFYSNGEIQYLCKRIPTPFDLIFRRFLPDNSALKVVCGLHNFKIAVIKPTHNNNRF